MNKIAIIGLLLFPLMGNAANLPCSGNKGGINHCEGSKFVCNDGSTSTKDTKLSESWIVPKGCNKG